ncbi:heparin lyase I family protein [Rhizobium ruizarguesonis]
MCGTVLRFAFLLAVLAGPAASEEVFFDNFDPPSLNEQTWCQCQISASKTPVNLWRDPHDQVTSATITVNESSLGGKACNPTCVVPLSTMQMDGVESDQTNDETSEELGPPLTVRTNALADSATGYVSYCDDDAIWRGRQAQQEGEEPCTQRQEIRLHKHLKFPSADIQTYTFRFRMPKAVLNNKDSIRWITAQWKQDEYDEAGYAESLPKGPSPVVAQRYDDGILWVTVQSDLCRCIVASSSPTDTNGRPWTEGIPSDCRTIDARQPGAPKCAAPDLYATYENGGVLSSPFQTWVEMKYVMRFTAEEGNFIEVHQNGKRILKLTGPIGYRLRGKPSLTKFKMGIYRDYIPQEDMIDVDWIRVSVDKSK